MADDIIGQGSDAERSRWPRRLTVIAVLIVLAAVILRHLPRGEVTPVRHPGSVVTTDPVVTNGPVQLAGLGAAVAGGLNRPGHNAGPTVPWRRGLRLLVTDGRPEWLWPATGRTMRIGGLPHDRSGYVVIRVGSGWAIQPGVFSRACGGCAGPALPLYFLAAHARSVVRIGTADDVAPAATAGAMWLTSYRPGANPSLDSGTAREISVTGAPLGPGVKLPAGYRIVQGTDRGLLLASVIERSPRTAYLLWDPATGGIRHSFDRVIAASPRKIAWAAECGRNCLLFVLDLATDSNVAVGLPDGSLPVSGAFSPDGAFLALEMSVSSASGARIGRLMVATTDRGRLMAVPGALASSSALDGFGWPGNGDSLVLELTVRAATEVVSWHPGARRVALAVLAHGRTKE